MLYVKANYYVSPDITQRKRGSVGSNIGPFRSVTYGLYHNSVQKQIRFKQIKDSKKLSYLSNKL